MVATYRVGRRCLSTGMFALDLACWARRRASAATSTAISGAIAGPADTDSVDTGSVDTGWLDTVIGGATSAACSGERWDQAPRSTAIVEPGRSVSAMTSPS